MEIVKLLQRKVEGNSTLEVFFGFENLWSGWIIVLFLAGSLFLLYLAYRAQIKILPRSVIFTLFLLRILSLSLILFCLFKPVLISKKEVKADNHLVILLDNSRSMTVADLEDKLERIAWVKQKLFREGSKFLKQFQKKYLLDIFSFSAGAKFLGALDFFPLKDEPSGEEKKEAEIKENVLRKKIQNLEADGQETNIEKSLSDVKNFLKGKQVAGIVLFSDGNDNTYSDFIPRILEMNIPIFTIGVGKVEKKKKEKDLELLRTVTNKYSLKDRISLIQVSFKSTGFENETVYVYLKKGEEVVRTEPVKLEEGQEIYNLELEYIPREPGEQKLTVELAPLEGEGNIENNNKKIFLKVLETENKVLYIEGSLRWEYKFLKRILKANENIKLVTVLLTGIKKAAVSGDKIYKFPKDKEDLYSYDAIILGSLKRTYFSANQLQDIYDFVAERGGALITLGGEKSYGPGEYKDSPLEKILPVIMGGKDDGHYNQKFKIKITEAGKKHPIFWLGKDFNKNLKVWAGMPELEGCNKVVRAKPGATVIAEYQPGTVSCPIIAVQRFGKGKTLSLMVDTTWKWDFKPWNKGSKETVYARFWNHVMRWAISKEESSDLKKSKLLLVQADKESVSVNQLISFKVRVLNEDLLLDEEAEIYGDVLTPDEKTIPLKFDLSHEEKGMYIASYVPDKEGEYSLVAYKKNNGFKEGEDKIMFSAVKISNELKNTDLNENSLQKIAVKSKGNYYQYQAPEIDDLISKVLFEEIKETEVKEREIWNTLYVYFILIFLLLSEWLLRRKRELI